MQYGTIQFEVETSHIHATGNSINVVTKSSMKLVPWWSFEELTHQKKQQKLVTFMVLIMRIGHILPILS